MELYIIKYCISIIFRIFTLNSILLMISWTEILFEQMWMVNVFDMHSLGVNIFSCWTRARDKNLIWNSFYIFNLASFVCIIITHLVKGCLKTKWADNQINQTIRFNYFVYVCCCMISRVIRYTKACKLCPCFNGHLIGIVIAQIYLLISLNHIKILVWSVDDMRAQEWNMV